MGKINIANLKIELNKLNKKIDEYEKIYLNIYNELSSSLIYWKDSESVKFGDSVNIEKLDVEDMISELKDVSEIYSYLIKKYGFIGNKIEFIPKSINLILSKFDVFLDSLYEVVDIYKEIDLKRFPDEKLIISKQIDGFLKIIDDTVKLRDKIKKKYELLIEIEKDVNLRISKIGINYIR